MCPLRESSSWTERYKEDIEVEPLRRYYLIFEGEIAENKYFKGVVNHKKEIGINNNIELIVLCKEAEIRNHSHPKNLLDLIEGKKEELIDQYNYDNERDQFVIVFDRDSFREEDEYFDFLEKASKQNLLTITSPCFELWLLLHYENAIRDYIQPNYSDILINRKISNMHSYISKLCSEITSINPKKRLNFNNIKNHINLAIEQENMLEQDNKKLFSHIGSNVGLLISQMRIDPREELFSKNS